LTTQANNILTAVVQGARKEEPSEEVRLAAIGALYNSLEFVKENFGREGERNYIMQVVCEATQSKEVQVQIVAFECLVRIMQLYYDKMPFYMQKAVYGVSSGPVWAMFFKMTNTHLLPKILTLVFFVIDHCPRHEA